MVSYGRLSLFFALFFVSLWEEALQIPTTMNKTGNIWVHRGDEQKFVRIANLLKSRKIEFNLTIHCKSKDDDLGIHVLGYNKYFEWTFFINIWGTTLFFCGLNWRDASKTFDAYKVKRDKNRCNRCLWVAKNDGVYGYTDSGQNDIKLGW